MLGKKNCRKLIESLTEFVPHIINVAKKKHLNGSKIYLFINLFYLFIYKFILFIYL